MRLIFTFISALLFGLGLGISGMTRPSIVLAFLDLTGDWDPSLLAVMVTAVLFHGISYFLIMKRKSPILSETFHLPGNRKVDRRLLIGSAVFGVGWGTLGYCPGPALASLTSFSATPIVFVGSMIFGMAIYHYPFNRFISEDGKASSSSHESLT